MVRNVKDARSKKYFFDKGEVFSLDRLFHREGRGVRGRETSVSDGEIPEFTGGRFEAGIDVGDAGSRRAVAAPRLVLEEFFFRPLGHRFDAAVREVFDPSGEAKRLGGIPCRGPEKNPLNKTGDDEMKLSHGSMVRQAHHVPIRTP